VNNNHQSLHDEAFGITHKYGYAPLIVAGEVMPRQFT